MTAKFFKEPLKKAVLCLCGALFFASCMTTYYYPSHKFAKKSLTPVKNGLLEFTVFKGRALSPPPGIIKDLKTARKKGSREAGRLIKKFCGGNFLILDVSSETRQDGWQGYTSSYYGAYGGFSSTTMRPVYNQYTKVAFECSSSSELSVL